MGIFKYVNFPVFIISLVLGILAVFITVPDKKIIYVYPTPENIALLQYRDKADNCFSYKETEVDCPSNVKDISKIPSQN